MKRKSAANGHAIAHFITKTGRASSLRVAEYFTYVNLFATKRYSVFVCAIGRTRGKDVPS